MKKLFLVSFIVFLFCVNGFSQIQRTFFGCSFGCTKQHVAQKMKSMGYKVYNTEDECMVESTALHTIQFGGYKWECIDFKFFKNALYNVTIYSTSNTQSKEILKSSYNQLVEKLDKKYSSFRYWNHNDSASWVDSKTGIICRHLYIKNGEIVSDSSYGSQLNLYLWYYDVNITAKTKKAEDNEL